MAGLDTPLIMAAVAEKVGSLPGIAGASYPADNYVPASPWAMVRQSVRVPASYEKRRFGQQIVTAPVEVVLLVVSSEHNQRDAARIDPLITPVLDAFDVSLTGGSAAASLGLIEPTGDEVLQVWNEAAVERGPLRWGAQYCHAAIIRLDVRFGRKPHGGVSND